MCKQISEEEIRTVQQIEATIDESKGAKGNNLKTKNISVNVILKTLELIIKRAGDTTVEHFKVVNIAQAITERGHQRRVVAMKLLYVSPQTK